MSHITYLNPVINYDFADPSVIKAKDGYYYAYGTRSYAPGNTTHIQVARSSNLVDWEMLSDALPTKPAWASHTNEFWAPQVIEDSLYYLYYSTDPDNARGMGIGVATSENPYGPLPW
jgi:arabinan endo-1,5-alpha-L-arabinosidase